MIHLDTSFLIRAMARGSGEATLLKKWLASHPIAMSAIAWTGFLCGPVEPGHLDFLSRILGEPIPFLPDDAVLAAKLFNVGGRRRGTLVDCMIAATAIRSNASLATANREHFERFDELRLVP